MAMKIYILNIEIWVDPRVWHNSIISNMQIKERDTGNKLNIV